MFSDLWRKLKFLLRLPWVGDIGGKAFGTPVVVDDPRFGESSWIPAILEIHVDDEHATDHRGHAELANVGHLVHERLFPEHPPFMFNVCFSCARSNPFRPGLYGDPRSIWWNVFFGFYEIDVDKEVWGRPFGYRPSGDGFEIDFEEIARIGKADWNYFSNYVYGVPDEHCHAFDNVDMNEVQVDSLGQTQLKCGLFDELVLSNVEVASAYTPDTSLLKWPSPLFTGVYRVLFGQPAPQKDDPRVFPGTRMKAHLFMAFGEDDDVDRPGVRQYKTYIFGGVINTDALVTPAENEAFLEVQLKAVKDVIENHYDDLGFKADSCATPSV